MDTDSALVRLLAILPPSWHLETARYPRKQTWWARAYRWDAFRPSAPKKICFEAEGLTLAQTFNRLADKLHK